MPLNPARLNERNWAIRTQVLRVIAELIQVSNGGEMPLITKRVSVAAGAVATPLSGDQFEFLQFPAVVEFALTCDAITTTPPVATIFSGSDLLQQEGPIPVKTTAIQYPDDYSLTDIAAQSDRLNVLIRNADSATRIVNVNVKITPV